MGLLSVVIFIVNFRCVHDLEWCIFLPSVNIVIQNLEDRVKERNFEIHFRNWVFNIILLVLILLIVMYLCRNVFVIVLFNSHKTVIRLSDILVVCQVVFSFSELRTCRRFQNQCSVVHDLVSVQLLSRHSCFSITWWHLTQLLIKSTQMLNVLSVLPHEIEFYLQIYHEQFDLVEDF